MISNLQRLVRIIVTAIVIVAMLLAYSVWSAIHTKNTTGILQANADSPSATLSISGVDTGAQQIGVGTAQVRLATGDYVVASRDNGTFATKVVHISAKQTTKVTINAALSVAAASTSSTGPNFINFDILTNNGISAGQLTNVEQLFQTYQSSAKTFTITQGSVLQAGHDPASNDPTFTITFSGTADSTAYSATLQYVGFNDNVVLTLTNPQTGAQLFAGNAPSSPSS